MRCPISILSSALLLLGLAAAILALLPWSLPAVWLGWRIWKTS